MGNMSLDWMILCLGLDHAILDFNIDTCSRKRFPGGVLI